MAVTTRNTNTINAGPNSRVVVNQHVDNSSRVGACGRTFAAHGGYGVRGEARRGNVGARGGRGRGADVRTRGALQPHQAFIQFSNIQGSVTFHGPVTFNVCPHHQ